MRRRWREVEQSPFCTFQRKNWRSERAVSLMPVIKMGSWESGNGFGVWNGSAHTHTFTSPLCRERRPRFRLQSFHGGFGSGVTTRSHKEEAKNSQRQNYCVYTIFFLCTWICNPSFFFSRRSCVCFLSWYWKPLASIKHSQTDFGQEIFEGSLAAGDYLDNCDMIHNY